MRGDKGRGVSRRRGGGRKRSGGMVREIEYSLPQATCDN